MWTYQWLIIRHVASDEVRISRTVCGYRPILEAGYTFAGPYDTKEGAENALRLRNPQAHRQLYPETYSHAAT